MARFVHALDRLLPDPSPPLVFEIGEASVEGVRRSGGEILAHAERKLPTAEEADGESMASEVLQEAIGELLEAIGPAPSPDAAVLLPDPDTRLAVFEFETVPRRTKDLRAAIQDRFRHGLPFDSKTARIAWQVQSGPGPVPVLAIAASDDAVRRCEAACEGVGLTAGYVGLSTATSLNLVTDPAMTLVLRASGHTMTLAAVEAGVVRLVRRIALPDGFASDLDAALREILPDLLPTMVYIEENFGRPASRLLAWGLGESLQPALDALSGEIGCPVEALADTTMPGGAGLRGYLHG